MKHILLSHFTGTIGRLEYFIRLVLYVCIFLLGILLIYHNPATLPWLIAVFIYAKISLLGAISQRLASAGYSRWFTLLVLLPYLNILFVLALLIPREHREQDFHLPPLPPFKMPKNALSKSGK